MMVIWWSDLLVWSVVVRRSAMLVQSSRGATEIDGLTHGTASCQSVYYAMLCPLKVVHVWRWRVNIFAVHPPVLLLLLHWIWGLSKTHTRSSAGDESLTHCRTGVDDVPWWYYIESIRQGFLLLVVYRWPIKFNVRSQIKLITSNKWCGNENLHTIMCRAECTPQPATHLSIWFWC